MYFKRIEMHGFKSFADPVTIEFDQGITCVVGPNGSGKSNISDAIRWVLGEQSPKMLRGSKMDDVIFSGTSNRKSRGMAEVTFVLDNTTGILPIEFNEVAITRKMYRSGESEYLINNTPCRMRDIRELLMDTGIGVDGYSLIGQGKIAEIISNKTESIREIFEETAGIVSYRTKKQEAERRMSSAEANLERVRDIIGEIEARIGGLKEDSEKAKEYLSLKDRYKDLEINIILNTLKSMEEKGKIFKEDRINLGRQLEEIEKNSEENKAKDDELNGEIESLEAKLQLERENFYRLLDITKELEKEIEVTYSQKEGLLHSKESLEGELLQLADKLTRAEENLKKENKQREFLLEDKNKINNLLAMSVETLASLQDSADTIRNRAEDYKESIIRHTGSVSGLREERASLEALKANLEQGSETLKKTREASEKKKADKLQSLEELSYEYQELTGEKKELEEEVSGQEAAVKNAKAREEEARALRQELNLKLEKAKSRQHTIREMEANYEGYNSGVKFVMKKEISGILGVIGELIKVPEKYITAMETALGQGMQNIICKDADVAKKAVAGLKENKAGRVTFLPLASIKSRTVNNNSDVEKQKGFLCHGIDAVSFDSEYKPAMGYLLGGIVVFDNIDNAVSASKNMKRGFKLVTLEGEVINPAGAVTGGKYKNASANLLSRRTEIDKLTVEIAELENEEKKTFDIERNSKKQFEELSLSIAETKIALRDIRDELVQKSQNMGILRSQLTEIEEQEEKWIRTLKDSEKEKLRIDELVESIEVKLKDLETNIENSNNSVRETEEKLFAKEEEIKAQEAEVTKHRIDLAAKEKEVEGHEALILSGGRIASSLKLEKETKEARLADIISRIDSIKSSDELSDRLQAISLDKQNADDLIARLQENLTGLKAGRAAILKRHEELAVRQGQLASQKYELDIKLTKQETNEDNLKEKLWEEFEISYIEALSLADPDFVMSRSVKENREIKARLRELGDVNVKAIEEYEQVSDRYEFMTEQKSDIEASMEELKEIIEGMDKIIRSRFKESFDQVVSHFKTIFAEFFQGGEANITIEENADPLEGNIEITAQPPGKQLKNINLLSGGEKTMTAIALMFAVLKTKPTPCCILDEVEAALDDNNIDIFANYLRKFRDIQFTLITHQKATMEHADVLYGVTMPERGISKIYSLKLGDKNTERFTQ